MSPLKKKTYENAGQVYRSLTKLAQKGSYCCSYVQTPGRGAPQFPQLAAGAGSPTDAFLFVCVRKLSISIQALQIEHSKLS